MSSHHLPVAPPGAVPMWNGSAWIWTSPYALGYTSLMEFGDHLYDEANFIRNLDFTSGSLALARDMFGPTDVYRTKYGQGNYGSKCVLRIDTPILVTYVEARHADELIICGESQTGAKFIHLYGPRGSTGQSSEWTSGSPFVKIPYSAELVVLSDTDGPLYYSDPSCVSWRCLSYAYGNNPEYLAWYLTYNKVTWTQFTGGQSNMYMHYCAFSGYRISKPLSLKDLGSNTDGVRISWIGIGNITFDIRISYNGGTTFPAQVTGLQNGDMIPGLYIGQDLTDVVVVTQANMTAEEGNCVLPALYSYQLEVSKYHSDKHGDDAIDQLYAISSGSPAVALPGMIWVTP